MTITGGAHSKEQELQGIDEGEVGQPETERKDEQHAQGKKPRRRPVKVIALAVRPQEAQPQSQERGHQRQVLEVGKYPDLGGQPANDEQFQEKRQHAQKEKLSLSGRGG